jgi:hypothetical protein
VPSASHAELRLTTAFDFKTPNACRHIKLPSTQAYEPQDFLRHPDAVVVPPTDQVPPGQDGEEVRGGEGIPVGSASG